MTRILESILGALMLIFFGYLMFFEKVSLHQLIGIVCLAGAVAWVLYTTIDVILDWIIARKRKAEK